MQGVWHVTCSTTETSEGLSIPGPHLLRKVSDSPAVAMAIAPLSVAPGVR